MSLAYAIRFYFASVVYEISARSWAGRQKSHEPAGRNNSNVLKSRWKIADVASHNVVRSRLQSAFEHFVVVWIASNVKPFAGSDENRGITHEA